MDGTCVFPFITGEAIELGNFDLAGCSSWGECLTLSLSPAPLVPKAQSEKCVPDRDPRWQVLDVTKKAVASPRTLLLAKPRVRKEFNEDYNPYYISKASLMARASPRLYELATPKSITKKV